MDDVTRARPEANGDGRQIANFSPITRAFAGSAAYQYRVLVVIRWYGAGGGAVVGRTTHRADWYSWFGVPSFKGLCPSRCSSRSVLAVCDIAVRDKYRTPR